MTFKPQLDRDFEALAEEIVTAGAARVSWVVVLLLVSEAREEEVEGVRTPPLSLFPSARGEVTSPRVDSL